jgi:hypothetical protein
MFAFRPQFGFNVAEDQDVPGFRVRPLDGSTVGPDQDVPGFRVGPDGNPDPNFQFVKDPLRCSGPNSDCSEWYGKKYRSPGTFRDIENPPFRLCPQCFLKTYKRPGQGDDVRLTPPAGYPMTDTSSIT